MSWTCPLCSSDNEDSNLRCFCGYELDVQKEQNKNNLTVLPNNLTNGISESFKGWTCPKCNTKNANYVIEGVKKTMCLCGYDSLSDDVDPDVSIENKVDKIAAQTENKTSTKIYRSWFRPYGWFLLLAGAPVFCVIAVWSFLLNVIFPALFATGGFIFSLPMGWTLVKRKPIDKAMYDIVFFLPLLLVGATYLLLDVALPWHNRDQLLAQLQSSDPVKRADAIEGLGKTVDGPGEHVQSITDAILVSVQDADPRVRKEAARILGVRKDNRAREWLSFLARNDPHPEVREKAAWALEKLGSEDPSSPGGKRSRTAAEWGMIFFGTLGTVIGTIIIWIRFGWILGMITAIGAIRLLKRLFIF